LRPRRAFELTDLFTESGLLQALNTVDLPDKELAWVAAQAMDV